MEPAKLTEYEQKRLENIKRNQEMISALNIQSKITQLSASNKRQKVEKTYKVSPKKKPKSDDSPVVIRRSLRTRGIAPESDGIQDDDLKESGPKYSPTPARPSPCSGGVRIVRRDGRRHMDKPKKNGRKKSADWGNFLPPGWAAANPRPPLAPPRNHGHGPLKMTDAFTGVGSYEKLIEAILDVAKKSQMGTSVEQPFDEVKSCKEEARDDLNESGNFVRSALKPEFGEIKPCKDELSSGLEEDNGNFGNTSNSIEKKFDEIKPIKDEIKPIKDEIVCGLSVGTINSDVNVKVKKYEFQPGSSLDSNSLSLKEENIARLVPGRIMSVKFLPCDDLRVVMVGNKSGNVAFWNMDSNNEEDGDDDHGIYLYRPHSAPVSGIAVQQSCLSKIFTSGYDGCLRLMDAEKEVFDLTYSCDDAIFSLSQRPNDAHTLYFAEGRGMINIWDVRTGKCSAELNLHDLRINTIDFNSTNNNIMATSSTDKTACLWDLRCLGTAEPKALKIVKHKRGINSAYFSPSGRSLATTSLDNKVGIVSGVNFEDTSMISHYNQSGRWLSKFRATWGWDDSDLFIGNPRSRGVDIICPAQRKTVMTLESPLMTAIPCTLTPHPYHVGMLAGATSGGQVYVWTS